MLATGGSSSSGACEASERLCRAGWFPLRGYVRSKGFSPRDAEDLIQELFARFPASGAGRAVSAERGRFRAYLLASMNHFLANQSDRWRAQKRGGGQAAWSLDAAAAEERLRMDLAADPTPEQLYERRWAVTLLGKVVERLGAELVAEGKAATFDALRAFRPDPAEITSYAEASRRFDTAEAAARKTVQRLRARHRALLWAEAAPTVAAPHEVEDELRHLRAVFEA